MARGNVESTWATMALRILPKTLFFRKRRVGSRVGDQSDNDYQKDIEVRAENGPTRSGETDQISKREAYLTKTTTRRRSRTSHSQPAMFFATQRRELSRGASVRCVFDSAILLRHL